MGIVNWHKEIENDQLHDPKDFSLATKGDLFWKDGFNEIEYLQMPVLPAVLDLVTASSAPPSEVHGNRYVLIDTTAVNAAWDGAQKNDWVEYDSSADVWVNITPEEGAVVYDKDTDILYKYDGSTWSSASGAIGSFVKTDGTTPLTADWDAGAYEITAESLKVDGTGGDGHFHMRYQSAIPTGAANNSKLFAGSTGALGWVVDSNAYAFYLDMTGNTASRTLTVPDASGTIALTTDVQNLGTNDLTSADNARTFTLKTGATSTQNFQILNSSGKKGFYFDGTSSVGFLTSSFDSVGGGQYTNISFGDSTNEVAIGYHLATSGYSQYYAFRMFSGANVLHNTDARGFIQWQNQANNANTDIQFNLVGNGSRITTNSPSNSLWAVGYTHAYQGIIQLQIATDNNLNGYLTVHKNDGSVRNIISGNRAYEATWFADGIVLGGARYRAATPFFDVMGAGSTSATTTALFQNSSSVACLTIKDDLTSTFGGVITTPQVINTPKTITVTANAGTVTRANRVNNFTNSSAAAMTITMSTTAALDGDLVQVRIYDFSAATQTITWVNTENSSITVPATSNGSTTLPLTVGFQYNSATSKWRCIGSV